MVRVEHWEDWEKTILRRSWVKLGNMDSRDNAMDKIRLEWRMHLDWLGISARVMMRWVGVKFEKWNSRLQADLQQTPTPATVRSTGSRAAMGWMNVGRRQR